MRITLTTLASVMLLTACGGDFRHPDTSGCELNLSVAPFYKDLMTNNADIQHLATSLEDKYGDYFSTFCSAELRIGKKGDPMFIEELTRFINAPENDEVIPACDSVWSSLNINNDISDAFSCFRAIFPDAPYPSAVYCHFSGFNDRMFVDSTYISFGIEHYLGSNCRFYAWLQIPQYARFTRSKDYIVSDLLKAWIYSTMPETSDREDVLTAMIYQGKVLYALHSCIPSISDELLFGMSTDQIEWCKTNESRMWAYLAEHKLLYSTVLLDRSKIVNEAPFTYYFGNKSPGRAALYCAYNIVRAYMSRHENISMTDLMRIDDSQELLSGSAYNP